MVWFSCSSNNNCCCMTSIVFNFVWSKRIVHITQKVVYTVYKIFQCHQIWRLICSAIILRITITQIICLFMQFKSRIHHTNVKHKTRKRKNIYCSWHIFMHSLILQKENTLSRIARFQSCQQCFKFPFCLLLFILVHLSTIRLWPVKFF